jgi:hypothetical protein
MSQGRPRRFSFGIQKIAFRLKLALSHSRFRVRVSQRRNGSRWLVPRGEGQQSDVAGLLDGASQTALMGGANAGETPGHDLAALGHEALQQADIAIRNRVDLLGAELADLLAAKELAATARTTGGPTTRATAGAGA